MMIETNLRPAVHDSVLVEAAIDGRTVNFRALVVNVLPGALWLGLMKPDSLLERVQPGEEVGLTFRRNGGGMLATATFLSHLGSSQSRLFSVRWNDEGELAQRRVHLRLDTECPIEYTVVSQSDAAWTGQTGIGVTRNISAGGVQFRVDAPVSETVAARDSLELRIHLNDDVILAEADVVRVEDATDLGPDGRLVPLRKTTRRPATLIAVEFVAISDAAQDRIVRHIFSLQRRRRNALRPRV
jgi:hypothetical protein